LHLAQAEKASKTNSIVKDSPGKKLKANFGYEQSPINSAGPEREAALWTYPRRWEFDDSLAEPDQGSWAKVCFTVEREDGQMVDAEMLRPQA